MQQISFALALVIGVSSAGAIERGAVQATPGASVSPADRLVSFDADVLQARRLMRRACGLAQQLAASAVPDTAKREEAIRLIGDMKRQWAGIQTEYSSAPPPAYAKDRSFASRLNSIDESMVQMIALLRADEPMKAAKTACGGACARFVAMHEENGLTYALDRIYHLRMRTRVAIAAGQIGGPDHLRDIMPDLLYLRDRVVLAPCPTMGDAARCTQYQAAVRDVSTTLDDLAGCIVRSDSERTLEILGELLAKVNHAYGLAM